MRRAALGVLKSGNRIAAEATKEIRMLLRRPRAFVTLIAGPFLVMALFGVGYTGLRRPLDTILVIPADSQFSRDPAYYDKLSAGVLRVRDVTTDTAAARRRLDRREVDLVIRAPQDLRARLMDNERALIEIAYNEVDPVLAAYAEIVAYRLAQEVNQEIIRRVVEGGQDLAVERLEQRIEKRLSGEVAAAPTETRTSNVAPTAPGVVTFFGPGIDALVIQHVAVSLAALSLVRERRSGAYEIFRVSPARPFEILAGKYIGFSLISAAAAGCLPGFSSSGSRCRSSATRSCSSRSSRR